MLTNALKLDLKHLENLQRITFYHIFDNIKKTLSYCVLSYFQKLWKTLSYSVYHILYDKNCTLSYFFNMIKKIKI